MTEKVSSSSAVLENLPQIRNNLKNKNVFLWDVMQIKIWAYKSLKKKSKSTMLNIPTNVATNQMI